MTVTGSGFAAGTTIASVAGEWPWSAATLTLSTSPSGSPSSCTISQPFLATLVAQRVSNNEFFGNWDLSTYPMICAGGAALNRHHDGYGAYKAATSYALLARCDGGATGNTFGLLESGLCVGSSYSYDDFEQGDLVMKRAGYNGVVRCDGSRKPLGAAIRAISSSAGCVDYLIRGTTEELEAPIVVNNRSADSIPAGSLLKVDTANPGGIVAAANLADGPAIGLNGDSAIPGGSAGHARELWF